VLVLADGTASLDFLFAGTSAVFGLFFSAKSAASQSALTSADRAASFAFAFAIAKAFAFALINAEEDGTIGRGLNEIAAKIWVSA
jgi:hypothetical protein